MSLADYLAKNYLTADSKPEKKSKKRKRKEQADGTLVIDDDASLDLGKTSQDQEDDGPVTGTQRLSKSLPVDDHVDSHVNSEQPLGGLPPVQNLRLEDHRGARSELSRASSGGRHHRIRGSRERGPGRSRR